MSERPRCRQRLHELLRTQYDCAGQLLSVLQSEAEALINRDLDLLQTLAAEKQRLTVHLDQSDADMQRLLQDHGYGNQRSNVTDCIAWCDDSGQLLRGWNALMDRVARCQQQNRSNGVLLDSSRRHAQQVLSILRGSAPAPDLYNPTGHTAQPGIAGRSLAKA